jgi:hypothetical protein
VTRSLPFGKQGKGESEIESHANLSQPQNTMNIIVLDSFTTMTQFLIEPNRRKHLPYFEGDDVREIFYKHWEKMKKKRTNTINDIQEWRDSIIEQIKRHAEEQIRILDDDYNRQRVRFDEERKKKISERCDPAASKQSDHCERFLETCRLLKFKVAKLELIKCEVDYATVITVDAQMKAKEQRRISKHSSQSAISEERSEKDADENGNGDSAIASTATNQVNTQQVDQDCASSSQSHRGHLSFV